VGRREPARKYDRVVVVLVRVAALELLDLRPEDPAEFSLVLQFDRKIQRLDGILGRGERALRLRLWLGLKLAAARKEERDSREEEYVDFEVVSHDWHSLFRFELPDEVIA